MVLAKPGSITPHTKFKAEVYILTKKKAGAYAVLQGVSAAVLFADDGRDGDCGVAGGDGAGDAGRHVSLVIELITPVAMEKGLRFAIAKAATRWARARSRRLFSKTSQK